MVRATGPPADARRAGGRAGGGGGKPPPRRLRRPQKPRPLAGPTPRPPDASPTPTARQAHSPPRMPPALEDHGQTRACGLRSVKDRASGPAAERRPSGPSLRDRIPQADWPPWPQAPDRGVHASLPPPSGDRGATRQERTFSSSLEADLPPERVPLSPPFVNPSVLT